MKVQEVKINENIKRFILVNDEGLPILPVLKYIKFLDARGNTVRTQETYCYALKNYFEFLDQVECNYKEDLSINLLSEFITWLRNPHSNAKAISIKPTESKRSERTINLILTVVTSFYDFLYRNEDINTDIFDKVMKKIHIGRNSSFKDFLYHVNKDKPVNKNILKLKEPKKKVQILSKEEMEIIYSSVNDIRDKFLIRLLFETGFRASEVLNLQLEDFVYGHKSGHKIRLVNRGESPNGAALKTGEREVYVSQNIMDMFDDYVYEVLDELDLDTNYVFVKLRGKNIGKPIEYSDIKSLFNRIRKRTGINVHAHLLRHTHATLFYHQTNDIKQVQERLGHSQIQTTIGLYVHPSDEQIRAKWDLAQPAFDIFNTKEEN